MTHAAPADQPTSVRQITDRPLPAYTIHRGPVHPAGCPLEDRIFLRLELRRGDRCVEIYVDDAGRPVDAERVESLGMAETIRLANPPDALKLDLARPLQSGAELAEARLVGRGRPERTRTTVLWCKYAQGKLRFTVDEHAAELAFSDWARPLEPPPFVCPYTGQSTFHLAATDDGRIVAAEQIETCSETGRRMLADELVTCAATGRRVARELTVVCPVTGQYVLQREMVRCGTCGQMVSPGAVEGNGCAACQRLEPVAKADPRMARLLGEHPRLDRWKGWRIAVTATVYILTAAGWLKRLLVVVDKESLELKLLATGSRFQPGWREVEPSQYEFALRG